ncbi:MAG: ABC transporter permease [Thermoanaerobaculia bacterium]|nr:ABC transporter permease [Thermoanaerobaculia bacterium]
MSSFSQDFFQSLRALARRPGFTVVVGGTLVICLGLNTAIFSIIDAVLFRPLPFADVDQIATVSLLRAPAGDEPAGKTFLDSATLLVWQTNNKAIEQLAAYHEDMFTLTGLGGAERIQGAEISPSMLQLLRTAPALGQPIPANSQRTRSDHIALLSHRIWQRRFSTGLEIGKQTLTLDGASYTIVGIMPESFSFPSKETDVWIPLVLGNDAQPSEDSINRDYYPALVRLRPGVSIEQAVAEGQAAYNAVNEPSSGRTDIEAGDRVVLTPFRSEITAHVRPALLTMLTAAACLLAIACANLAGLFLVRNASREHEIAMRLALGGSRTRVACQVLTECVLLSLSGGLIGLVITGWTHQLLPRILLIDSPPLDETAFSASVFLFSLLAALVAGLSFGLLPVLRVARLDIAGALRGAPGTVMATGSGHRRFVVLELALTVVLLTCAGILTRSFLLLTAVDPGFEPEQVLAGSINLEPSRYGRQGKSEAFFDELLTRLEPHPGVVAAGVVSFPPFGSGFSLIGLDIIGSANTPAKDARACPQLTSPGFLEAMGLRLVEGRWLSEADHVDGAPVAIVNKTFAHRFLGGESPIGQRLAVGTGELEVVGVVDDMLLFGLDSDPKAAFFFSYRSAFRIIDAAPSQLSLVIRTKSEPMALAPFLRESIAAIDPETPLDDLMLMEDKLTTSVAKPRLYAAIVGVFAGLATLLAAAGVYGVLAYGIRERTREIGLRIALGAKRREIVEMVVKSAIGMAATGLILGVPAAYGIARLLSSLLFKVAPFDPLAYSVAIVLVVGIAILASLGPAWRASHLDPRALLRHE